MPKLRTQKKPPPRVTPGGPPAAVRSSPVEALRRQVAALLGGDTIPRPGRADVADRRRLALALLAEPGTAAQALKLLAGVEDAEAMVRLEALARLRQGEPAAALSTLAAIRRPSPLASLALGLARLAAGQGEAAASFEAVRRSRGALPGAARHAAAIAGVVAHTRAGQLDAALKLLRAQDEPDEPALRAALAAAARALAQELVLEERLADALLALEQALATVPGHEPTCRAAAHVREVLATRAVRRGDFATAARQWEAALAILPAEPRIAQNLALAEERQERWPAASAHWERLAHLWKKEVRTAPREGELPTLLRQRLGVVYRHLAGTYEAADDLAAAAQALERALTLDPSEVQLRLRAAELYLETEQYGSAIEHLRRVLAVRPGDVRVLADLGEAYDLKGDDQQAQQYLEQALALEPGNAAVTATLASVYHGRGHRLGTAGQTARMAAAFERAAELHPTSAEHHQCLGDAYLQLGRLEAARSAFARALARTPGDPKVKVAIGGSYLARGYPKEAERLFREALGRRRDPLTRIAVGVACLRAGHPERAQQYFQPILKERQPLVHAAVGKLLINLKQETAALPFLEQAVAQDPLDLRARLDLAWAYTFGSRDYQRALRELDTAEPAARAAQATSILDEIRDARLTLQALLDPSLPTRAVAARF